MLIHLNDVPVGFIPALTWSLSAHFLTQCHLLSPGLSEASLPLTEVLGARGFLYSGCP